MFCPPTTVENEHVFFLIRVQFSSVLIHITAHRLLSLPPGGQGMDLQETLGFIYSILRTRALPIEAFQVLLKCHLLNGNSGDLSADFRHLVP